MSRVTVRVVPRALRPSVGIGPDGSVVVHVRAAPERGRATEEARRTLAGALHVAPTRIHLRTGARSRIKVFEVEGLDERTVRTRLSAG